MVACLRDEYYALRLIYVRASCVCRANGGEYTYVECEREDDERWMTSRACRQLIQFAVLAAAACDLSI